MNAVADDGCVSEDGSGRQLLAIVRQVGRRSPRRVDSAIPDARPTGKLVEVLERRRSDAAVDVVQEQDDGIFLVDESVCVLPAAGTSLWHDRSCRAMRPAGRVVPPICVA